MTNCIPCKYKNRYDLETVRWLKAERLLCEDHMKKANELITAAEKIVREPGENG